MKTAEYTTKRIIAQGPEEKAVVKSWGSLWSRFGTRERTGKHIILIFGDWSGYRSSQYRITHIDYALVYGNPGQEIPENYHGTVRFTDNTTMNVWTQRVTREYILLNKLSRKESYGRLINLLIKSGTHF